MTQLTAGRHRRIDSLLADGAPVLHGGTAGRWLLSRTIAVKEKAMSALLNKMCAALVALLLLTSAGIVTAGFVLWPADAAQSEARTWIRHGDSCRYVPLSEALNALPCQQ
jgi:hypothetical protein